MMLKGTTYEESSLLLPRLRGGTADARSRSGQSRRREGTVRGRSRGLPRQGGSHDRGVVSAWRTRHGPSARRPCVRLRARRPDYHAVERPTCLHAQGGQTFYEGPTDVHVVGRNASNTEPARFVVVLLKGKGAPILTPVKE